MADNYKSYKNKIKDFGIRKGSFKGDDGSQVEYQQVILTVDTEDGIEEILLSGQTPPKPKSIALMLRGALDQNSNRNILNDEDTE